MSGVRNTSKPSVIPLELPGLADRNCHDGSSRNTEPNNNAYNKLATAHEVCLKIGISPQKWLFDLENDYIPVDEIPMISQRIYPISQNGVNGVKTQNPGTLLFTPQTSQ